MANPDYASDGETDNVVGSGRDPGNSPSRPQPAPRRTLQAGLQSLQGRPCYALLNLEAYSEVLSLLRPFFTHGWHGLRSDLRKDDAAYLANAAAIALHNIEEFEESITAGTVALTSYLRLAAVLSSCAMRKLAGLLILSLAAATAANASLIIIIPAKGATVVCADRRFLATGGRQFDSDDKLQLVSPHALFFVIGLEAVSTNGKVLFAPGAILRRFLAEQAAEGIPSDIAIQDDAKIGQYLREAFEKFLSENRFPPPKSMPAGLQAGFMLGILRMDNHLPSLTVLKVSQDSNELFTSVFVPIIDHFFSGSDPMYLGQLDVVQSIAEQDSRFSRFFADPYVREFILTNFGKPLTSPATALKAARRLISITADGLKTLPRPMASVSKESVCAVMDYLKETVLR